MPAIDEIIIRSLHGTASVEEEHRLRCWREATAANETHYRGMERLWGLIQHAEPAVRGTVPPTEDIVHRATIRPTASVGPRKYRRGRRSAVAWTAAAAAAVTLALGIAQLRSSGESDAAASQVAELSTGAGEIATLQLPDGSVVRLAPRSRLRFTGTPGVRDVWLDGRAFFAVAKQNRVPFRVRSRAGEALVLGTRFDIRVGEDDLRLLVVEGRVALSAGDEHVEVEAGELTRAAPGVEPTVQKVHDMRPMLEWMGEFLVFLSTPLDQFAREFEEHYGIEVRILDEDLAERTVTGWFTDQPADEVLRMVCQAADVHCLIRDAVATIAP